MTLIQIAKLGRMYLPFSEVKQEKMQISTGERAKRKIVDRRRAGGRHSQGSINDETQVREYTNIIERNEK